jgi:DNA-binding LacI/PurR family transcriptional regulator
VRVPKFEVGRTAAEILHREIENTTPGAPSKVYLHAELIVRETTAPPNSAPRNGRPA